MNYPLVSICIPVYNGEKYLEECLASVVKQTYRNVEVILVDDRSTDRSVEIVNAFIADHPTMRLYVNEKNSGLVENWNRCIEIAKGEWIKFVFQDDYLPDNCLERMMQFASNDNQFIICNRKYIYADGVSDLLKNEYELKTFSLDKLGNYHKPVFIDNKEVNKITAQNLNTNYFGEPIVVLFSREVIHRFGLFNDDFKQICDLEYWLRVSNKIGVFYIPETLAFFRVHASSASSNNRSNRRDLVDEILLLDEFINNPFFGDFKKSLSLFFRIKIKLLRAFRLQELEKIRKQRQNEKLNSHFDFIKSKYPGIFSATFYSFIVGLFYNVLLLRRWVLNKFGIKIG